MSRRFLLSLVALTSSASAGLASAMVPVQDRSLEEMLPEYSRCVVTEKPAEAQKVVLSNKALYNFNPAGRREPSSSKCTHVFAGNKDVQFIPSWYRDELALALVQSEFASNGPSSFADKGSLNLLALPAKSLPRYQYAKTELDNARLGECIARADPSGVRAWLVTPNDGAQADTLKDRLAPLYGRCSRALGAHMLGGLTRAPLARAYYRLAKAPSIQVGTN